MNLVRQFDQLPEAARHGAVSIGNFDGVHRGHATLVEQLRRAAQRVDGPAVVFTFDPHPARLLRPEKHPLPLTWLERKVALLGELGVDWVVAYPTDPDLLALDPHEFFEQIVVRSLAARVVIEGPNFYFGRNRAGNVERLRQYCGEADVELQIVDPQQTGETLISSSRIRQLLVAGEVSEAAELLTQPYRIRGVVQLGAQRGRTIGFPTANVGQVDTLLPADGVYAARAETAGKVVAAAVNIGSNPTFGEDGRKVEAHLLDFADDIYDQPIQIEFLARLRGVERFSSAEALQAQLSRDVEAVRQLVDPARADL